MQRRDLTVALALRQIQQTIFFRRSLKLAVRSFVALALSAVIFFAILKCGASASTGGLIAIFLACLFELVLLKVSLPLKLSKLESARLLDAVLHSKDRCVTWASLDPAAPDLLATTRIIEKQIADLLSGWTGKSLLPKESWRSESLLALLFVLLLGLAMWLAQGLAFSKVQANSAQADVIRELVKQEEALPESVKEKLEDLARAIDDRPLSAQEVQEALESAQAEIDKAQAELAEAENDAAPPTPEPGATVPAAEATPTPTPSPVPSPAQEKKESEKPQQEPDVQHDKSSKSEEQGKDQKESKDKGDDGQQGQQGGNQGEQQGEGKDSKSGSESKQGGQGDGQQQEKQDAAAGGQGQSGSQQDGQEKQQQGQSGAGQQQQQAEQKDAQSGKQDGQGQSQQQALDKAEAALKDVKQAAQKESQQNAEASPGGDKGQSPGQEAGQQGNDSEQGKGGKPNAPKAGQDSGEQKGEKKSESGEEGQKAQPNAPGKSGQNSQPQKAKEDNQASQSSLGAQGDTAKRFSEGDGPPQDPLEGKKGFTESAIANKDEKLDERFTDDKGTRAKNKAPAKFKTTIDDVKLARPEVRKEENSQPVPLEYKDLLK